MNDKSDNGTCRLCLNKINESLLLFHDLNIKTKVETVFKFECLQVKENKTLSKHICSTCYQIISNFYDYSGTVQQNQKYLETFLTTTEKAQGNDMLKFDFVDFNPLSEDNDIEDEQVNSKGEHNKNTKNCPETKVETISEAKEKKTKKQRPSKGYSGSKSDAKIREFIILNCTLCEDKPQFEIFKNLLEHYEEQHQTKGFATCCEKKFYRKDRLLDHVINHINPNHFKCPSCNHKSKSKVLLNIHMKQHLPDEQKAFKCENCNQRFVLKSQLTNHQATHLRDDQKKFACDECGKFFALKFVLKKHKLTHNKLRNYICEICAKSFSTKFNLVAHSLNHNDQIRPRVQCTVCSLWYKNVDTLRTHMRDRHAPNQNNVCQTCDKKFPTKVGLLTHTRYVHLKIRQYECNICSKLFRKKIELTEHVARHSGKSLYSCPFCPKTFSAGSNYFSHRKNKHPVEFAMMNNNSGASSSNLDDNV